MTTRLGALVASGSNEAMALERAIRKHADSAWKSVSKESKKVHFAKKEKSPERKPNWTGR